MALPHAAPLRSLATDLLDLLLPVRCAGCDAPGASPCPTCCAVLAGAGPRRFRTLVPVGSPVVVGTRYEGPVRGLLLAHKEHRRHGLRTPLGAVLADAVAQVLAEAVAVRAAPVALVPVPSSSAAVRGRHEDTVADLARAAARRLEGAGRSVRVVRGLAHRRRVDDQAGLPAWARRVNLAQALEVRPRALQHLIGVRVVVVDDVVTTGATAAEAGRALTARGIRVWGTAAVAGTVPPSAAAGANDERRDDVGPVVPGARHH